jgi:hypothetical protein
MILPCSADKLNCYLPEIQFNSFANDTMVKKVLESVWSRSNYDVFGELMEYLK